MKRRKERVASNDRKKSPTKWGESERAPKLSDYDPGALGTERKSGDQGRQDTACEDTVDELKTNFF